MSKLQAAPTSLPTRSLLPHARWSVEQAVGILSVDNITTSPLARQLLQAKAEGHLSHQDAVNAVLARAKTLASG